MKYSIFPLDSAYIISIFYRANPKVMTNFAQASLRN